MTPSGLHQIVGILLNIVMNYALLGRYLSKFRPVERSLCKLKLKLCSLASVAYL